MTLSARNHLVGKVEEIKLGNVMAHVVVRVGDNIIDSVITRRSAEEMELKVGDTVAAIIKIYRSYASEGLKGCHGETMTERRNRPF